MRGFVKYFLPPLIPLLPLLALAAWVLVDEAHADARMIDGVADNAPMRAAGLVLFISLPAYAGLLLIHCLCTVLRPQNSWFFTSYLIAIGGTTFALSIRSMLAGHWVGLQTMFVVSLCAILPMAGCSRLIRRWTDTPGAPACGTDGPG